MPMSSEVDSPSTWRFSMELLSHVHTLRVFLLPFSSQLRPGRDCANVEATLLSAPPALSCSWNAHHQEAAPRHSLRLPLPVLLFDYSSPPRISALTHCIQLSLYLLPLPPFHLHALSTFSLHGTGPTDISGTAHAAIDTGFSVADDTEGAHCEKDDNALQVYDRSGTHESMQSSTSAVDCITCNENTSLKFDFIHTNISPVGINADVSSEGEGINDTKQDACSASNSNGFSIDSNYASKGVCVHDTNQSPEEDGAHCDTARNVISTSNNHICYHDGVVRDAKEDIHIACSHAIQSQGKDHTLEHVSLGHLSVFKCDNPKGGAVEASAGSVLCQHAHVAKTGASPYSQSDVHANQILSSHQGSDDYTSQGTANFACKNCLFKVSRKPVRSFMQLPCFDWREIVENWFGACCCSFGSAAEALSVSFERSLHLHPGKCLVGPSTFFVHFSDVIEIAESGSLGNEAHMEPLSSARFLGLGNGFMVWENQYTKNYKWLPVHCTSCGSLIGAYPRTFTDSGLLSEGLYLFRCQIIICKTNGTPYDAYRYETFKALLVKELKQRTDENTCHRFLIRSLSSERPLLQLVVLSYNSLTCTGRVNAGEVEQSQYISKSTCCLNEIRLQQSMKVLFLDCSGFSEDDFRSAELWAKEHDAEAVFMLEEFVHKLRDELLANSLFCPAECWLFQSFMGSFLYTTRD